jgi:hypothetical protein
MDKAGPAKAVIGGGDGRPLSAGAVTTVKPERSVATVQHAAVTMNVEQVSIDRLSLVTVHGVGPVLTRAGAPLWIC